MLTSQLMALTLPAGCARLTVSPPAHVRLRRPSVPNTYAAISSPTRTAGDDAVDWIEATSCFFQQDSRPIMLFDGVCNLCNGGVKFVRDNDPQSLDDIVDFLKHIKEQEVQSYKKIAGQVYEMLKIPFKRIRYEALQSEAGKKLLRRSGRAPDDISSVVLVEKDRSYIKSEAVLKIMEYIDLPFPQLAFFLQFVPLFIRDFFYDNVANNRYSFFGRSDSCEV